MGPDGGDGGRGGSVILEVSVEQSSLTPLKYMNHYEGKDGQHGLGSDCHGHGGDDVIVKVPAGTMVFGIAHTPVTRVRNPYLESDAETALANEEENDFDHVSFVNNEDDDFDDDLDSDDDDGSGNKSEGLELLVDMIEPGQRFVVAHGGRGGRGNLHFKSSMNRAPRRSDPGEIGEFRQLRLELKTVADAGLVGYPNAGKSTLLTVISNARPEVAPYPFTTITPHVGIVEYPDTFDRLSVADIPGLIEGAHENIGLGHEFLRHIERTKVLVYVLDTAGIDGRLPWDDLKSLQHELECYQVGLSKRPALIVANKMDEPEAAANLKKLKTYTKLPIYPLCAILSDGLDAFKKALYDRVRHA